MAIRREHGYTLAWTRCARLNTELYEAHHYKHFIYAPVGFVCEHLEVLYDNDYECKVICDDIGATYHRPVMPNVDPLFIGAIVDEIKSIF